MAGQESLMRAGRFNKRITFREKIETQNEIGEWVISYEDWATVWAAIEPMTGKMYFQAKQANSEVEGIVVIRYRKGILPTMQIKYGDRIFSIISIIQPKENHRELDIFYKEALD